MNFIHATAIVHPKAKIGRGVKIGPFTVIQDAGVELEEGVEISSHVHIEGDVTIGSGTRIGAFTTIGMPPQDRGYAKERSFVFIGKNCDIRDHVSINRGVGEGSQTIIGDGCMIMGAVHVAHNCKVGKGVVITQGSMLGGYVTLEDFVNIGGACTVHQKVSIGRYVMVGGMSGVGQDIPPFCIGGGRPLEVSGLNRVGLMRKDFSLKDRQLLVSLFDITYRSNLKWIDAKEQILMNFGENPLAIEWATFCDHSKRGIVGYRARAKERELTGASR